MEDKENIDHNSNFSEGDKRDKGHLDNSSSSKDFNFSDDKQPDKDLNKLAKHKRLYQFVFLKN